MKLPLLSRALAVGSLLAVACQSSATKPSASKDVSVGAAGGSALMNSISQEPSSRKLVIENSQIFELKSEETGRQYEIIVGLPPSYGKEPQRSYPVLYVMDGQWDFILVNKLTGGLRYDQFIDEFLVVGVSYGGENPDYGKLRGEDYTPTRSHPSHSKMPFGGDADKFLRFLTGKVLPLVETKFPVDTSQRMISGTSLGGLFVLYAMLERPELFQTVLSISPAVHWDDRDLFRREVAFSQSHKSLNTRLWVSVGAEDWPHFVAGQKDLTEQLLQHNYVGLELKTRVVEGERHAGVKPEAYNRAVRFAFEPWAKKHPRK